jgi:potassium inwardly-rectifying channel subfamily J
MESSLPGENSLFLQWPVVVSHCIDHRSPLWDVTEDDLLTDYFEVIVILEGNVASTGMLTQVGTSYLATEIRWLHRLAPLLTYRVDSNGYKIDHSKFHETIPQGLKAACSAQELFEYHVYRQLKAEREKKAEAEKRKMEAEAEAGDGESSGIVILTP